MCLAIPRKIIAILDPGEPRVLVEGQDGTEEVSAALLGWQDDFVGRWTVTHSGFILSLIDEEEARSRLSIFAAMNGRPVASDALRPEPEASEARERFHG